MSEADNPNLEPEITRSLESADVVDTPTAPSASEFGDEPRPSAERSVGDDGWQTVDFPGAISIDTMLSESASEEGDAPPFSASETVASGPGGHPGEEKLAELVQHLRVENTELRTQVTQLEADLAQVQIELQLEVARFYCKEEDAAPDREQWQRSRTELATAQEQIRQLSQELEFSRQTAHSQQILVDTLTQQLEGSQERIAQLERDCALSQQRYNEQVQLVLQVENACRDLRMRLHRQQQQTLQFKAALEKSLEMNGGRNMDWIDAEPVPSHPAQESPDSAFFVPKAKPVQPWSTIPGAPVPRLSPVPHRSNAGLPDSLVRLCDADGTPEPSPEAEQPTIAAVDLPSFQQDGLSHPVTPAVSAPQPQAELSDVDELQQLFPEPLAPPSYPVAPAHIPQEPVFDLSPFLEAGEVDGASLAASRVVTPVEVSPPSPVEQVQQVQADAGQELFGHGGDSLWADLARLIEPEAVEQNAAIDPALSMTVDTPSQRSPELRPDTVPAETFSSNPDSQELETWLHSPMSQLPAEPMGGKARRLPQQPVNAQVDSPSPFITLKAPVEQIREIPDAVNEEVVSEAQEPSETTPPNWPSPVVYPFRQPKKLTSMASVDLPTFPRG